MTTDAKGHYQVRVGPGTYAPQVPNETICPSEQVTDVIRNDKKNPGVKTQHREVMVETITVKDEKELIHDLWIPKPADGPDLRASRRRGRPVAGRRRRESARPCHASELGADHRRCRGPLPRPAQAPEDGRARQEPRRIARRLDRNPRR